MPDTSGLDMAYTMLWYASSDVKLPELPRSSSSPPLVDGHYLDFRATDFGDMLRLFPKQARRRSALRNVVGKPVMWFRKGSTSKNIKTTNNPSEALSLTALVPSYTDPSPWKQRQLDIWMYQLPGEVPRDVRRMMTVQSFLHEVGHTLTGPAFYIRGYKLRLPDGRTITGAAYLERFAEAAEGVQPISHYSSFYRQGGKFVGKKGDYRVAVSEELCESIAAYLLGFAYTGDDRGLRPFSDRPGILRLTREFLHAELART